MSVEIVEAVFEARRVQGFALAIVQHPAGGYECRLRQGAELATVEPGRSAGHPSILEAVLATDARLEALLLARREGEATELIDQWLAPGRLRSVEVEVDGEPVRQWEARAAHGRWIGPEPTPRAAVRAARRADTDEGAIRGGDHR